MTSGTLVVRVYATQAQLPIPGASVIVTQGDNGSKQKLLSIQITDKSGAVPPLQVEAPQPKESTQPQQGMPAYAVCSVWVEHPEFAMLRLDGVQIFAGQTTWQDVELIPLGRDGSSLEQGQAWDISAQNL